MIVVIVVAVIVIHAIAVIVVCWVNTYAYMSCC